MELTAILIALAQVAAQLNVVNFLRGAGRGVDFSQPVQVIIDDGDDTPVRFEVLRVVPGAAYPIVCLVSTDDGTAAESFDLAGNSQSGDFTLRNVVQANEEEDVQDTPEPKAGVVTLPPILQKRVRHTKRGTGTVIKVRADRKRSMLVRLDNPGYGRDPEVWALDRNVQDLAGYGY